MHSIAYGLSRSSARDDFQQHSLGVAAYMFIFIMADTSNIDPKATAADLEHELEITRNSLADAHAQLAKLRTEQQAAKLELESTSSVQRELQELEVAYDQLKTR